MIPIFSTLHKNWLPSLIFSPAGRDKSEGAGCGSLFFRGLLGIGLLTGFVIGGGQRSRAGQGLIGFAGPLLARQAVITTLAEVLGEP